VVGSELPKSFGSPQTALKTVLPRIFGPCARHRHCHSPTHNFPTSVPYQLEDTDRAIMLLLAEDKETFRRWILSKVETM
jgi:hypothetical protein